MHNTRVRVLDDSSVEPVTFEEVQESSKLSLAIEENFIKTLISGCRIEIELLTNRTIHMKRLELSFDCLPANYYGDFIELPYATPLIEVESVTLVDSDAVETAFTDYVEDTRSLPGRLYSAYNTSWPSFTRHPVAPYRIVYTAGISPSTPQATPAHIKELMLLMVGFGVLNRESHITPDRITVALLNHPRFESLLRLLKVPHIYTWETA